MRLATPALLIYAVATAALAEQPIMRVNGVDVSPGEFNVIKRAVTQQALGRQIPEAALLKQAVDQIVDRTILVQAAREAKVTVDPKAIDAALEQQRAQLGGQANVDKMLAELGLTEKESRRLAEEKLLIQQFIGGDMANQVAVSDDEVKSYYQGHPDEFRHTEQVKLWLILAKVERNADPKAWDAAKAKAEAALKRLQGGEAFAKVAAEVSDDASKARGGDLGWIGRGVLFPELEDAVFALGAGETSGVIKGQDGYHVFRVDAKRPAGLDPLDEAASRIKVILKARKLHDSMGAFMRERKAKAKVEILDPEVKAALGAQPAPAAVPPAKP